MRQAVVSFGAEALDALGFEVFQDAGVRNTEILSCEGARGVVRIHVEEQLDGRRLDETDAIQWWERVATGESECVYLVNVDVTAADDDNAVSSEGDDETAASAEGERNPRCEHVEITERGMTVTYVGSQTGIREELAEFDGTGSAVTLKELHGYRAQDYPLQALTDRQRDVMELAFERGYYDVPRSTSVEEIATELGLNDSTVAEHLQRAERNLLSAVLDGTR